MSRRLIVSDGRRDRELLLVGRIVVGRDPTCDIGDGNSLLSRRHAEFVGESDVVVVRDLGSRNGIFINGMKVAEGALQTGDSVQIGPLRVQFIEDDTPLGVAHHAREADATILLSQSPPSAEAPPVDAPVAQVTDAGDATFVISPGSGRGSNSGAPLAVVAPLEPIGPVVSAADKDDGTFVITAPIPEPHPTTTELRAGQPGDRGRAALEAGTHSTSPGALFVHAHVTMLAGLVFAVATLAMSAWQRRIADGSSQAGASSLVQWLTLPAIVVLLAAYVVGTRITRRASRGSIAMPDGGES